jgi:hypothetical protein
VLTNTILDSWVKTRQNLIAKVNLIFFNELPNQVKKGQYLFFAKNININVLMILQENIFFIEN